MTSLVASLLAANAAVGQTVPSFGEVEVPSTGGRAPAPVAASGESPAVPAPSKAAPRDVAPSRAWRTACAGLAGPRPGLKYAYVSRSGALSQIWLNKDGSYSLQRSSAYSSYAEDGCYSIAGGQVVFLKWASSALAETSAPPGGTRVILGSATDAHAFDRTARPITLIGGGRGGLVLDGDRYDVAR